jgi:uncharacterized protein
LIGVGEVAALVAAGAVAGSLNTVVGSGSLVTFPVLLAFGVPPVTANVTNNVGIFPGSISGSIAYRRELSGYLGSALRLATLSAVAGACGALLLLRLPSSVFRAVVPIMIASACVLVIVQPLLRRRVARDAECGAARPRSRRPFLRVGVAATGLYGGYFGAAQGVILLALLTSWSGHGVQRANAIKNVLGAVTNLSAAVVFTLLAQVDWQASAAIAVGALAGGQIGGHIARRLPDALFRLAIIAFGLVALARLLA